MVSELNFAAAKLKQFSSLYVSVNFLLAVTYFFFGEVLLTIAPSAFCVTISDYSSRD
jgi:hypothetical protein